MAKKTNKTVKSLTGSTPDNILTDFEVRQLTEKSNAYTDEVLANQVTYPDPDDLPFDEITLDHAIAHGFAGITDSIDLQLFKNRGKNSKKNRGNKGGGNKGGNGSGRQLPNPATIEREVTRMMSAMQPVDNTGNLIFGEMNFEFGDASKAKFFAGSYKIIFERHHLMFGSELDDGFQQTIANMLPGYKAYTSVENTRHQAVGFVVHPRLKVIGSPISYDDVANVQGVPDLRPAFRLDLEDTATGEQFSAVVVHLKSMRGGPAVSGKVRSQQCAILVKKLGSNFKGLIAGDWNTFIDRPTDLQPLLNAGWKIIFPNDTQATQSMGSRLDAFLKLNFGPIGNLSVRQFYANPAITRAFSDHALNTVRKRVCVGPAATDTACGTVDDPTGPFGDNPSQPAELDQ
ncbi:MAG: hypothetical protein KGS72_18430 [Cyanobacteria bacterium REEB67]|nr:hypothetical protein [Cyanobacteria bacterium REEB67]